MYPAHYFSLFPPFPRENKVFVAMSFDSQFNNRWENVIGPAIREQNLEPYRVDTQSISDSILTKILVEIANDQIIFVDLTTIGFLNNRAIRNSNVMYELGLAQASRLPEEIIVFRSDNDELPFDLKDVRVNSYEPDEKLEEAKTKIRNAIANAGAEVDLRKSLAVKATAESLDYNCFTVLIIAIGENGLMHPPVTNMGTALGYAGQLAAINRLLDLKVIIAEYKNITIELLETIRGNPRTWEGVIVYRATLFGRAVADFIFEHMALLRPEIQEFLQNIPSFGEKS